MDDKSWVHFDTPRESRKTYHHWKRLLKECFIQNFIQTKRLGMDSASPIQGVFQDTRINEAKLFTEVCRLTTARTLTPQHLRKLWTSTSNCRKNHSGHWTSHEDKVTRRCFTMVRSEHRPTLIRWWILAPLMKQEAPIAADGFRPKTLNLYPSSLWN